MAAVLRLIPDPLTVPIEDRLGDLLARMRGQAVQGERVGELFAHMYGVGKRVNASSVLVATAVSILTVWGWLHLLP